MSEGELLYCPTCDLKTTQKQISAKKTNMGMTILRKCLRCGKGVELTLSWDEHPLKEPTIECAMKTPLDWNIKAVELP